MLRWINGKNPMQYGFDFGLWTRKIVQDLAVSRFGVKLSLASVGAMLSGGVGPPGGPACRTAG